MPGIAASTSETWLLGSPPNSVEAPENSFEFEVTWAWTSMPITTSQSPVVPLISLLTAALMPLLSRAAQTPSAPIRFPANRSRPVDQPAGTNSRHCRDRLQPDADRHGPRRNWRRLRPERSCVPRPTCLLQPTTERPAARQVPAQARRRTDWF